MAAYFCKRILFNVLSPLITASMKPVCLPLTQELQNQYMDGMPGKVAGWGATEDGLQSPVLLNVELPIVANKECQEAYHGLVFPG